MRAPLRVVAIVETAPGDWGDAVGVLLETPAGDRVLCRSIPSTEGPRWTSWELKHTDGRRVSLALYRSAEA